MKKTALVLLIFLCFPGRALAWDSKPLHDRFVEVFKDIEAIFSWHMDDRKTLKEVTEETVRGILH